MPERIKKNLDLRDSFIATAEITRKVFQTNLAPMAILSRRRGRILDVNDAFLMAFELERASTINRTMAELGLIDPAKHVEALEATRRTGVIRNIELRFRSQDGTSRFLAWSAELIRFETEECFLSVFQDLTRRKQAEAALNGSMQRVEAMNRQLEQEIERANLYAAKAAEASGAKSAFLAHTSHELRTPLNAIVGFTEMLLDDELSSGQRHLLKMIELSAEHLRSLIDNLLDLSKIEAHRIELEQVPFNLETLVYQSAEQVAAKLISPGVELLVDLTQAPIDVQGDPNRLRQILANLLSNAAKHTREGFILVHGRELDHDEERIHLAFEVHDSGCGIPPDALASIFEPFVQTGETVARRSDGTGLGLAITRHLVSLMSGAISVESTPGGGSVFSFDIFLRRQASNRDPSWTAGFTELVDRQILLLEDNPVAAEVAAALLHQAGAKVTAAASLADARVALEARRFNFVFADIGLEGRDPAMLARELKQLLGASTAPVIAISKEALQPRQLRVGFDGYLTKPLRMKPLVTLVNQILGVSASSDKVTLPPGKLAAPFHRHSILVAEDHVVNQHMMIHMLERMGHDVTVASDGHAAVEMALKGSFDLLFMDIQMPGLSGIEATLELRRRGVSIPIIALTAVAMKGDKDRILKSGMNDYVAKPVKQHMLEEVIERHLGSGAASDAQRRLRTLVVSDDDQAVAAIEQAIDFVLPGLKLRVASTSVAGYVQIGSTKPSLLFVDLSVPGIDAFQLVDFLQFEEQYSGLNLIALTDAQTPRPVVEYLFLFPGVTVLAKPLDARAVASCVERLVSAGLWFPGRAEAQYTLEELSIEPAGPSVGGSLPNASDLAAALGLDSEEFMGLLHEYLESNGEHLSSIEEALSAGRLTDVHARAHAIHGSSANLGLAELAARARAMEESASAGDLRAANLELQPLKVAFAAVERFLELPSMPSSAQHG